MEGKGKCGLADRVGLGAPTYSQERDTSSGLTDAQPGTFGPHVTAREHLYFVLGVILYHWDGVI